MKNIKIERKEEWKSFIMNEAKYNVPDECSGGLCVDAGCNIGDFEMNHRNRFDKYVCFDVFEENIIEATKNTADIGAEVEINKLAVWSESNKFINVLAYEPWDTKNLQHFGNSGNVGCVEYKGERGEGWKQENTIDLIRTISIETIIEQYGHINLLKVDVEGSEYEFLLGKDLSKINYIVGEFHFEEEKIQGLIDWISNTHEVCNGYYKLKGL
jgi:FkbM family methyltransferase